MRNCSFLSELGKFVLLMVGIACRPAAPYRPDPAWWAGIQAGPVASTGLRDHPGMAPFVPDSFIPPASLDHAAFRLRPLGPEHNESDYAAWSSSIEHIRATPGFEGLSWPHPMTLDENLRDLVRHADDLSGRRGFTYTVLTGPEDDATVIGCVYIYPSEEAGFDSQVRSWVRAVDADLDPVLYRAVARWLEEAWPFERVDYAVRPGY